MTKGDIKTTFYRVSNSGSSAKFPKPPQLFERVTSHFGSCCDAIRTGKKASTDFDYGAPLADLTALVNVAQRAGCKKLLWDGSRVTNDAEANTFVAKDYRTGWDVS